MGVAAVVAAVLIAMVLWAGVIAKLARPNRIRVTVVALGVPVPASWTAVAALVVAEMGAALLILLAPGSPISSVVVVVLFGAFAVAGAVARRARAPIACACYGSGDEPLGWRQLAQLPVAVALVAVAREGDWAPQTGLALTAATLLGVAAWWALRVWPTWQRTRAMRVSLREAQMATNRLALEAESHG